jgi:hypothetical protein
MFSTKICWVQVRSSLRLIPDSERYWPIWPILILEYSLYLAATTDTSAGGDARRGSECLARHAPFPGAILILVYLL